MDPPMNRPSHILLVEDNRMDVGLTPDAFRERHLDNSVHVACNGQQALACLHGEGEHADRRAHPLPDLIPLDLKDLCTVHAPRRPGREPDERPLRRVTRSRPFRGTSGNGSPQSRPSAIQHDSRK